MAYQEHYFDDGPIRFYNRDEPYYEFTNFFQAPVLVDGKLWPTTEHYFQAQKFIGTPFTEVIRNFQRPREAFDLSRNPAVSRWRRKDWEEVKVDIMRKALLAKFTQHSDLRHLLLSTEDRDLIEHSPYDNFWGNGGDDSGQNRLGLLLMEIRDGLRSILGALVGTQPPPGAENQSGNNTLMSQPMDSNLETHKDESSEEDQFDSLHRTLDQEKTDENGNNLAKSEHDQQHDSQTQTNGDQRENLIDLSDTKVEESKVDKLVVDNRLPEKLPLPLQPVSPSTNYQGIAADAVAPNVPLQSAAGEQVTVTDGQTPVMPLHVQSTLPTSTSQGVVPTCTNVPPETAGEQLSILNSLLAVLPHDQAALLGGTHPGVVLPNSPSISSGTSQGVAPTCTNVPPEAAGEQPAILNSVLAVLPHDQSALLGGTHPGVVLPNSPSISSGRLDGIASHSGIPPIDQAVVPPDGIPQVTAPTTELQQPSSTGDPDDDMEIATNGEVGETPSILDQTSQNDPTAGSPQNIAVTGTSNFVQVLSQPSHPIVSTGAPQTVGATTVSTIVSPEHDEPEAMDTSSGTTNENPPTA